MKVMKLRLGLTLVCAFVSAMACAAGPEGYSGQPSAADAAKAQAWIAETAGENARRQQYCKDVLKEMQQVKMTDVQSNPAQVHHFDRIIKKYLAEESGRPGVEYALLASGPGDVNRLVTSRGSFLFFSRCQQHECNGHHFSLLLNPTTGQSWGAHYQDPALYKQNHQTGPVGIRYFGHPDPAMKRLLKGLACLG